MINFLIIFSTQKIIKLELTSIFMLRKNNLNESIEKKNVQLYLSQVINFNIQDARITFLLRLIIWYEDCFERI